MGPTMMVDCGGGGCGGGERESILVNAGWPLIRSERRVEIDWLMRSQMVLV